MEGRLTQNSLSLYICVYIHIYVYNGKEAEKKSYKIKQIVSSDSDVAYTMSVFALLHLTHNSIRRGGMLCVINWAWLRKEMRTMQFWMQNTKNCLRK